MGLLELERLLSALETGKIPCGNIAVNKVVPQTDCGFCSDRRAEQQGYIKKIHSRLNDRTIVQVPLFPRQIRGLKDLEEVGELLFCNGGPKSKVQWSVIGVQRVEGSIHRRDAEDAERQEVFLIC